MHKQQPQAWERALAEVEKFLADHTQPEWDGEKLMVYSRYLLSRYYSDERRIACEKAPRYLIYVALAVRDLERGIDPFCGAPIGGNTLKGMSMNDKRMLYGFIEPFALVVFPQFATEVRAQKNALETTFFQEVSENQRSYLNAVTL